MSLRKRGQGEGKREWKDNVSNSVPVPIMCIAHGYTAMWLCGAPIFELTQKIIN